MPASPRNNFRTAFPFQFLDFSATFLGITPCGPFLLLSFVFILFMARSGPNIEDVTARQRKPDVKGKRIDQKMPDVCFPVLESHFLFPLDNQIIQKEREM